MASIGEQIVAQLAATVSAAGPGKPAGLTVHRHLGLPIEQDALPAVVLYPNAEDPIESSHDGKVLRPLGVVAECRAQAVAPESADEAVDPVYVWTVKQVMSDQTVGGLAVQVREKRRGWDREMAGDLFVALLVEFEVSYETQMNDPETA